MSKTVEILGKDVAYDLSPVCRTTDKKSLHLPSGDAVDLLRAIQEVCLDSEVTIA